MTKNNKKSLTTEQKAVVTFNGRHSIVQAVAGSGKTTTLIKRVEFLIKNKNISPSDILILMYNKDAQVSFDNKLSKIKGLAIKPKVRTFHSFAKSIVDGNDSNYDRGQHDLLEPLTAKLFLKQSLMVNTPKNKAPSVAAIEELELFITYCKANNISPDSCETSEEIAGIDGNTELNRLAFGSFNQLCKDKKKRTFDDLLLGAMFDLIEFPQCVNNIKYIIVDEYQDVNLVQHSIIRLLTQQNTNVMVVGDSNQCIYGFRGSDVQFIDHVFARDFKEVSNLPLSKSFRFGHAVSMIANRVMLKNTIRSNMLCVSSADNCKTDVKLATYENLINEIILFTQKTGTKAILARNRSDLTESLIYLKLMAAPCQVGKKISFSKQAEMAFIAMITTLSINASDASTISSEALQSCLQGFLDCVSLKITNSEAYKLRGLLKKSVPEFQSKLIQLLQKNDNDLNDETIKFISPQPISLSDTFLPILAKMRQLNIINIAIDSSGNRRQSNNISRIFNNLEDITESKHLTCQDFLKIFDHENTADGIILSTIHGTKGLEWDHVILLGLTDESFPHSKDDADIQEERRLYYVGITRCIKSLTLLPPHDNVLDKWITNKLYTTPAHNNPVATRFLYESDLVRAVEFSHVCTNSEMPQEFYSNPQYREYHQQLMTIK